MIKSHRLKHDLTIIELAGKVGISEGMLKSYESGKVEPKFSMVIKIMKELGYGFVLKKLPRK